MNGLICLDAVIDIACGTRWRAVRRGSHGVSRDTVLKRLRLWMQAGAFGEIMDLLALRGVLGGALDLSRVSVDSPAQIAPRFRCSIRAKKEGRIPDVHTCNTAPGCGADKYLRYGAIYRFVFHLKVVSRNRELTCRLVVPSRCLRKP